ncbi:hypothetical protein TWF751_002127 [Orbilia oligospora]|nr:hypothetical protein TWF751_002127 [Orbilia oligospora]
MCSMRGASCPRGRSSINRATLVLLKVRISDFCSTIVDEGTSPTTTSEVGCGIPGITDEGKTLSKLEGTDGGAESTTPVSTEPGLASRGLKRNIAQEKIRRGGSRKRSLLFQGFRPEMLSRRLSYRTLKSFCQLLLEFMARGGTPAGGGWRVIEMTVAGDGVNQNEDGDEDEDENENENKDGSLGIGNR